MGKHKNENIKLNFIYCRPKHCAIQSQYYNHHDYFKTNKMDILGMFDPNTCSLDGGGAISWSWEEYFKKKKELGDKVILVDLIGQPVNGSTPISNELFKGKQPDGTYFVLYCHCGATSGSLQKKLAPQYPKYNIVSLIGGIDAYPLS